MLDLGVDLALVRSWFPHLQDTPYILIRVSPEHVQTWASTLKVPIRRCYVTDQVLLEAAERSGVSQTEIIAAKLPDPGSTMSGDFGEIVTYLYQGASLDGSTALGAVKWRLKQDRTKPAPHSDVVQFVLPSWPTPTADDCILCAEVKTKATQGNSTPIAKAIEDSRKDRVSRLARTLEWLRERCLIESVGDVTLTQLDRFRQADKYPPAQKRFSAVAVVCVSVVEAELLTAPATASPEYALVVIAIPDLQKLYTDVFSAARTAEIENDLPDLRWPVLKCPPLAGFQVSPEVETNPLTAMAYQIQSIPMQMFFVDGQKVKEIIGAVPENIIRATVEETLRRFPADPKGRLSAILKSWTGQNEIQNEKLKRWAAKNPDAEGEPVYHRALLAARDLKIASEHLSQALIELEELAPIIESRSPAAGR